MKKIIKLSLISIALFTACKKDIPNVKEEEKVDWNKASISLMNSLRPKLLTLWKIKEIVTSKDSVLYDLGELSINRVNNEGFYEIGNDVTGTIHYKTKSYPIGFRMVAIREHILNKQGPQVFAFFEYRFPVGSHITESEEDYLSSLTLINSNFEIELSENGKVMIWKGLGRKIKSIRFEKQ